MRPWVVWGTAVLAYIVAVLDRTTMGVSALEAAYRYGAGPSMLSVFVVLQIVVYAGAQIPAGVLLDRFGSRALITGGLLLMSVGQFTLAAASDLLTAVAARTFVGLGDAVVFISVVRLIPRWFEGRHVPVLTQSTWVLGQLGQVLSAVPFLTLLLGRGWESAYLSVAALGLLVALLVAVLVADAREGPRRAPARRGTQTKVAAPSAIWRRPGTRQGFFTHMGAQFSVTVFTLMWGVPYLTTAQGISERVAGLLLTASVWAAVLAGLPIGWLTAHYPHWRTTMALAIIAANATAWAIVLAAPTPAPMWLLVLLVVVISVGGPGSMIGLDLARTSSDVSTLGTAQGIVNMGGFLAAVVVIQSMGVVIGWCGGYTPACFRLAWGVQFLIWAGAAVGIVAASRAASTSGQDEAPSRAG